MEILRFGPIRMVLAVGFLDVWLCVNLDLLDPDRVPTVQAVSELDEEEEVEEEVEVLGAMVVMEDEQDGWRDGGREGGGKRARGGGRRGGEEGLQDQSVRLDQQDREWGSGPCCRWSFASGRHLV